MCRPRTASWLSRLACVISQPFGLPVVPEVKKSAASGSEGRRQSPVGIRSRLGGHHSTALASPRAQTGRSS